ncbi:MAG: hypothetical protein AABW58_04085 [Nanoarchaeota archaeon]
MPDLEKRTEETSLPINKTKTLEDGSKLTLEIYTFDARGLEGVKEGQVVIEKKLRVELQRKGCPKMPRVSSVRESWDVPIRNYLEMFERIRNYSDAVYQIEVINGVEHGWNRKNV